MKTETNKQRSKQDLIKAIKDFIIDCRLNGDLDEEIMDAIIEAVKLGSNDEFSVREE